MIEGVYITLAVVVVITSIFVFFSQEFGKVIRKLFSIPGAKLVIPLVIASTIVELYEEFGLWISLKAKDLYLRFVSHFSDWFSIHQNLIHIVFLFSVAMIPMMLLRLWEIRRNIPVPRPITIRLGLYVWLITAIILIIFPA